MPSASAPKGTEIAGWPVRFADTVQMSFTYMAQGSALRSPKQNAVVGAVGVISTSKRS